MHLRLRAVNRISTYLVTSGMLVAGWLSTPFAQAQVYPIPVTTANLETAPYNSAGLVFTTIGGTGYRGSAVVARDARLLYTCAHVLYENGSWATDIKFARGWHASTGPTSAQMVPVRGYRSYATYSGGNSASAFSLDFAIGYNTATTSFGPAVSAQEDGGALLRSASTQKLVLGYPARRDYDGANGYYYQHRTGPFTAAMRQSFDSYHTLSGVSTGGGNSGGPVLAYVEGKYSLAGILVSGSTTGMGVHGLNSTASSMAKNVLTSLGIPSSPAPAAGKTQTVANTSALLLPDGSATYSSRDLNVSGLPATASAMNFNLLVETTYRGDLDVYVRSPSGRVHWVKQHSPNESGRNLVVTNANYTTTFSGANPNGTWQVYMRDFYRTDRAYFKNSSLTITSL